MLKQGLPRYWGLAIISGSIVALQVIFTRIFSIMIWHHFTYLVIGVALLGGGTAGAFLAVRHWDRDKIERRLGMLAVAFSLSILINLLAMSVIEFDPLRARQIVQTLFGLTVYFGTLFATFFLGGLVIAAAFSLWVQHAHHLYFIDLLGAGLSTLVVLALTQSLGGPGALVLIAMLALATGWFFGGEWVRRWRWAIGLGGVGQLALLGWIVFAQPLQLPVPESKELGWALAYQGVERPEYTRWNPVARVDVMPEMIIAEPMIVGGVSSVWLEEVADNPPQYPLKLVTLDGTSMTGIYRFDGDLTRFDFLEHAIISAPYQLGIERPVVLNIGVGGGLDMLLAQLYDAERIKAIELNADVVELLRGPYAEYSGRLAFYPNTDLEVAEGRSYLIRDESQYDIIQGIGLDNLAALSGGAYVLAESYLYTVESFDLALSRLTPRGVFAWTRDTNEPPREMLRLAGLAAEALRRRGIAEPARHIAIVANEANVNATLLVASQPFTPETMEQLRAWGDANRFHMLQDPLVALDTVYADYLRAEDPRAFESAYEFNIYPVTDDNPFFYNYFRWTNLTTDSATIGRLNRFPIGNLILLTLIGLAVITSVLFVILPLWRHERAGLRTPQAMPMLAYFSLLGAGYIFVEIILIQRFTLFIGYPTLAVTTSIFSMLTFSAVGSLVSQRLLRQATHLRSALGVLVAAIIVYVLGLSVVLNSLLALSDTARLVASVLLIGPLAFLMGMPFPTALSRLGQQAPSLVPWAWGMNGIFSVLGSSLVILISMISNFSIAMLSAAVCYGAAAALAGRIWNVAQFRTKRTEAPASLPAAGDAPAA
ncbi:MAG TPA: hypothetical protein PLC98_23695 [Anaerolineales bacterium]|nr:hypothetical protein [Anaerolineales bacterium]